MVWSVYKVITAKHFLKNFASDRSHMINNATGEYMANPPKYPCIKCESINKAIFFIKSM